MIQLFFALVLTIFFSSSGHASEQLIASGKLKLGDGLNAKAKGIRTVFLVVYDPASRRPMPYGAQKMTLAKDASGEFTEFKITTTSLRTMGAGGAVPNPLRIKARLDKDGNAGMDQPGDIVGMIENVKLGTKSVSILLDKAK